MGTTFHGPSPWPHITRAIRTRGTRRAAIAHLGQDAPTLLPLRAGDVLVVNASHSSTIADEAVVITDDPGIVASVRTFIDGIEEITEVDQAFLDNATAQWQIGRAVPNDPRRQRPRAGRRCRAAEVVSTPDAGPP